MSHSDEPEDRPTRPPPYRASQRLLASLGERSVLAVAKEKLRDGLRAAHGAHADTFVAAAATAVDEVFTAIAHAYYEFGKVQGKADAASVCNAYRSVERAKCVASQMRADPRREPEEPTVSAGEVHAVMSAQGPIVYSPEELEGICRELGLPLGA